MKTEGGARLHLACESAPINSPFSAVVRWYKRMNQTVLHRRVSGHQYDCSCGKPALDFSQQLQAIHLGHSVVAQHQVEVVCSENFHSLAATRSGLNLMFLEQPGEAQSYILFVIDG